MGLDRVVTMMPGSFCISRGSTCALAVFAAVCSLAGCNQGSAPAQGPVLTPSLAAPAADLPSNPAVPAAAPASG
ncbi:MAG: hypothetical protein WCD57_21820, partial [Acidobacteriaceae bacterium]